NMGRVFDTYPRMMLTPDSPFQRFVQGESGALTSAQKRGLRLFIGKAACNDCHNGPTFSDNLFHNVGAPNVTIVPGSTTNAAPNRGRATAVAGQTAKLTALDEDPENPLIFNGAGKWSDNRELGRERLVPLRTQDREHCICRRVDGIADATACGKIVKYSTAYYTQLALKEARELRLPQDHRHRVDRERQVHRRRDQLRHPGASAPRHARRLPEVRRHARGH